MSNERFSALPESRRRRQVLGLLAGVATLAAGPAAAQSAAQSAIREDLFREDAALLAEADLKRREHISTEPT